MTGYTPILKSHFENLEAMSMALASSAPSSEAGKAHHTISRDASWFSDAADNSKHSAKGSPAELEDSDETEESNILKASEKHDK